MNHACSICLTDDIVQFNKCTTQCNHDFCKSCLDTWFDKGKNTCPICRQALQYFTYNGLSTRIISIEKEPVRRDINQVPVVTVTQFFYNSMKYFTMISVATNVVSLYIITQYCDM